MSESVIKLAEPDLADNVLDALTIDDEDSFVIVDTLQIKMQDTIKSKNGCSIVSSSDVITNVAQLLNVDEPLIENNEATDRKKELLDTDKELLAEQKYWEQNKTIVKKVSCKPKYLNRPRMTQKDDNIIANRKAIIRHPSSFQFDKSTTHILEMLQEKKYVGHYYNILGSGQNSVVIYAHCPITTRVHFIEGHAVKVYTLTSDVKKNCIILKKAQREFDHLKTLLHPYYCYVPYVVHHYRNVNVMGLIGSEQQSAPSITSLPAEQSQDTYNTIVNLMDAWYKKQGIVHGKLSVQNILLERNKPQFIGWSHSVKREHPMALRKLMRDCHFVTTFFERRDVPVVSTEQLFKSITGVNKLSSQLANVICEKSQYQWRHQNNPNRENDENPTAHEHFRNSRFNC